MGYALNTVGFQLKRGARPVIEGLVNLNDIVDIMIKKEYIQIFTRRDPNHPFWWISFKTSDVFDRWISLFFELKLANEDLRNFPMLRRSLEQENIFPSRSRIEELVDTTSENCELC